jgi:uncharacterized membrane protein
MTVQKVQSITIIVIVAAIVVLLGYDTWAAFTGTTNATISWVTWTYAHKYPIIPFLVGGLCGHLFFTQTSAQE